MKTEYWIALFVVGLLILLAKSGPNYFTGIASQRGLFGTSSTPVDPASTDFSFS